MRCTPSTDQEMNLRTVARGGSVLIVDDEEVIRDIFARALTDYEVTKAANGSEALAQLDRRAFDVIVTDVLMPDCGGLDLLRTIKEKQPNQPVIVMTGYAGRDTVLDALKADADDFITKPVDLLQLKTTVSRVLEKSALKAELLQLKRMDRLKTDFLGLISHKLKTPVTALSLFIQNLARGVSDPADPDFRQHLTLMAEESEHLIALIQDLLFYSSATLEERPLQQEPLDLRALVTSVLVEQTPLLEKKALQLDNQLPDACPPLQLDRERMRFVVQALLGNAVKFTPPGGRISLTLEDLGEQIELGIHDTGPGIPVEEQAKVFEKFYQVDPQHTGQIRGFGLGLFYARHFARQHDGSVRLASHPGKGTHVFLQLPR